MSIVLRLETYFENKSDANTVFLWWGGVGYSVLSGIREKKIPNHGSVADGLGLAVFEGGHQALLASGLWIEEGNMYK